MLNPNSIKAFHFPSFLRAISTLNTHLIRDTERAHDIKREHTRGTFHLYIGGVKERELKAPLIKWFCIHTFKGNYRP